MASLMKIASEYAEDFRDGIPWIIIWKTGRSWHATTLNLDYDTNKLAFAEDAETLQTIVKDDPGAVLLNGYVNGVFDEESTVKDVAEGIRWLYEETCTPLVNELPTLLAPGNEEPDFFTGKRVSGLNLDDILEAEAAEATNEPVRGYKVFSHRWTCLEKQYTCPGKFEEKVIPIVCDQGMHFCEKAVDCFSYYNFDPAYKVAEVIAYGIVVKKDDKCCTDKLEIVREISWAELLGLVNTGNGCSGYGNSGARNSGARNSGARNSGNWNSGARNSGNWNSGNGNSGNWNSGARNSGNWNSGDRNSGNGNSGARNSGNWNSGDRNSGDFNTANGCNGCFNTRSTKIYMFNQLTDWTQQDWITSEAYSILWGIVAKLVEWVPFSAMSDEENQEHPKAETSNGYLKTLNKEEQAELATQRWRLLPDEQKCTVLSLQNFNPEIFKQCTGIDVKADYDEYLECRGMG